MFTVNLEKKLIKENKKLFSPKELLIIEESDKLTQVNDEHILERTGFGNNLIEGRRMKERSMKLKTATKKFNQERVFHISQIQSICMKYYLRFLNVHFYSGSIPTDLATKISTFEIAYDLNCKETDLFIVAPKTSFKLEAKPKDPLLFYRINDEYYYLIHKWGNDLNVFRRLKALLSNNGPTILVLFLILVMPWLFLSKEVWLIAMGSFTFITCLWHIPDWFFGEHYLAWRLVKINEWNSKYID